MSALAALAAELGMGPDALRSAILSGGEDEALTPNYLTTNPDGTTSADFTGHIHAQGLDLDSSDLVVPTVDKMVRWLRTSDGAVVADILSFNTAIADVAQLRAHQVLAGAVSEVDIIAQNSDASRHAEIDVSVQPDGSGRIVLDMTSATGVDVGKILLQGDGSSNFIQSAVRNNLSLYMARLGCGNPPNVAAQSGLTGPMITRLGVGQFQLTHVAVPSNYLVAVASCQGNIANGATANYAPLTSTTSGLSITNSAGALIDGEVVCIIGIGF